MSAVGPPGDLPDFDEVVGRDALLERADTSLLELVDHVLDKGAVIEGELLLGLADVDLIYVRLSALVCAAERVLDRPSRPPGDAP
ncbi:MAG: gas vesicle protein [Planctomycetes bacterium]|nr:gas vesicle protein [Planctomycetota bacterium]